MPEDHTTNSSMPAAELSVGRLASQFEFLDVLDSGGMGVVYKARNVTINQIVAIKMIQSGTIDDKRVQRFNIEATALSTINHYNIVQVKSFGQTENGQPYMVLEYVDGVTLPQYLKGKDPELIVLRSVFIQIAEALSHAHEHGILHRDLKPSNIMIKLNQDGSPLVKIIDFGIAKLLTADSNGAVTQTGEVLGSPAYMSPEQISGSQQDARADIYSLGCVMFEALAGVPPFQADSPMDIIFQQLNAEAPNVRTKSNQKIPLSFANIVARCLQKDPNMRFQSMKELGTALSEATFVDPAKDYFPLIKKAMICGSVLLTVVISCSLIYLIHKSNENADRNAVLDAKRNAAVAVASAESSAFATPNAYVQKYINNHRDLETMELKDTCTDSALIEFTKGDFATKNVSLENSDVKGPGLAYLIRFPLKNLEMQRSSLTDRGLLEISKMQKLRNLTLDGTKVTSAGLKYLSQLELRKLSARDLDTDDQGLKNICKITTLEFLLLDGSPRVTDSGYAHLSELKNLETVGLRNAVVTDNLIKSILPMKSLRKLYLDDTNVNDEQLKLLSTSKTLKEIHLEHNKNVTAAGLKHLVAMPNLDSLDLRHDKWLKDSDLEIFRAMKRKFYLSLQDTNISDAGLKILAPTCVGELDLVGTRITDAGLLSLVKSKNLKILRVDEDEGITADGIKKFQNLRPDVQFNKQVAPTKYLSESSCSALVF